MTLPTLAAMDVSVTYQKSRVLQALRYHFIRKPELRIMAILVNVFALLSAALFAMGFVSALPFLMSTVLWLFLMTAIWIWMPLAVYHRNKTFREGFMIRLGEQHLFIHTSQGQQVWPWSVFSGLFETPHFIHLCLRDGRFFLIPKQELSEKNVLEEARKLLRGSIPKV